MSDSPKADLPVDGTENPDARPDMMAEPGFDLGGGTVAAPVKGASPDGGAGSAAYRVLARKYRPQSFSALIGQDAMVQTLGNAIKRDRLAHAFLMTGVRGVGKTSTARLIAKALNCIGPDGQGGPTIDPCGQCEPCVAIAEGRHIDVIEMDAASHTGVDDVREIIEAVRYAAVSARFKIYIIDEVHMLSKNAFNALLKTLEEPPAHVKFLFATTEVNKVPVTVLSRCQRFDLKRISSDMLARLFAEIVQKENVAADEEALKLIAQAAEGSARDGLSILDQAIAHADMDGDADGGHRVTAEQVRAMLGLSDRGAIRRLFGLVLAGDPQAMLAELRQQFELGVEPLAIMSGLLAEVHRLTLQKIGAPSDTALDSAARDEVAGLAGQISFSNLHRLWQLLLRGHEEVSRAAMPLECADMALLRIMHAAGLPDPGELARMIENGAQMSVGPERNQGDNGGAANGSTPATQMAPVMEDAAPVLPRDFPELLDRLAAANYLALESTLRDVVGVIEFAAPRLVYRLSGAVAPNFLADLQSALRTVTGVKWDLEEGQGEAAPSLREIELEEARKEHAAIMESPLVQAAFAAFPDARLLDREDPPAKRSLSA